MDAHCAGEVDVTMLSLCPICYDGPFWTSFWINDYDFWAKDLEYEVRVRASEMISFFGGW